MIFSNLDESWLKIKETVNKMTDKEVELLHKKKYDL
jgi:hypothetical protein